MDLRHETFESNPNDIAKNVIARGSTAWIRRSYTPLKSKSFDGEGETYVFYAAKTLRLFRKGKAERKDQLVRIMREIRLLKQCSKECEFVVSFLDAFFDGDNHVELGMEFCELGSLEHISEVMTVRGEILKCVMFCAFSAVTHVHKLGIVHGDVKPGNVLVNRKGIVKLCDFGCAQHLDSFVDDNTAECGTLRYAAPEVLPRFMGKKDFKVDFKQDVWALGILTVDLFYGPFLPEAFQLPRSFVREGSVCGTGESGTPNAAKVWSDTLREKHLGLDGEVAKGYASNELAGFVSNCLEVELDQRKSAVELLHGKYVCSQKTKKVYREVLSTFPVAIQAAEERE